MNDNARGQPRRGTTVPGRGGCVAVAVVGVTLLLMLYVLSLGPAVYLTETGLAPEPLFEFAYTPLIWLGDRYDWLGEAMEWYVNLWLPGWWIT